MVRLATVIQTKLCDASDRHVSRKNSETSRSLMRRWSGHLTRVTVGIGLIAIGALALAAPFAVGTWSLQFLGLPMLAVAMADLYATITSPRLRTRPASYATSILATAAALVLYLSPSLVASGVVAIFLTLLVADGAVKAGQAVFGPPSGTTRTVAILNSIPSFILALIGFWVWKNLGLQIALGIAVAGYAAAAGWRLLIAPAHQREDDQTSDATNLHPDSRLNLGSHELFGTGIASRAASAPIVGRIELHWLTVAGVVLFVVHLARMESSDTWLGLISPVVATAGDVLMAILFGALLVLPLRLGWRFLTRPFERAAWRLRFSGQDAAVASFSSAPDSGMDRCAAVVRSIAARRTKFAVIRRGPGDPPWLATHRAVRRRQHDLGIHLVLQHGKLGECFLSEDGRTARRHMACRHG